MRRVPHDSGRAHLQVARTHEMFIRKNTMHAQKWLWNDHRFKAPRTTYNVPRGPRTDDRPHSKAYDPQAPRDLGMWNLDKLFTLHRFPFLGIQPSKFISTQPPLKRNPTPQR